MEYIMALDEGTTSCRCIIFDKKGRIVSVAQQEFPQIYPAEGWVEHDAENIYEVQLDVAKRAIAKAEISPEQIKGIGITNQRETAVLWDKRTGKPVHNAIVWQCRRTADYCTELKKQGYTDFFRDKTGLLIDAYFSATKLRWLLKNVPDAMEKAKNGDLLFGTIDTWLIWNLTGGKVHATDYTNASRTMLFNIHTLTWDKEILELLEIPECVLPKVCATSGIVGETKVFGGSIPIAGFGGDQQCALFGQCCFETGDVKNTYGTGGFLLMNTGDRAVKSHSGLLTTIAWGIDGKITYALEGSVFVAGAAIQWLRDELGIIKISEETEEISMSVSDNGGVYFVPAFVGMGAPYWEQKARGSITGITRGTNYRHIVRAALEGIAYQTADVVLAMESDSGLRLNNLKVDGGASSNNFLMQFQSDILGKTTVRPQCVETTAMGAAFLAGLATGFWKDTDEISKMCYSESITEFVPAISDSRRNKLVCGWKNAVEKVILPEKTF